MRPNQEWPVRVTAPRVGRADLRCAFACALGGQPVVIVGDTAV